MKLSVIIPAFNEAKTIKTIITDLLAIKVVQEIIVVNDASIDDTKKIVKRIKDPKIIYIEHPENLGKGKAIQTGLNYATQEYVLIQDADLEYNPKDIPQLIKPIQEKLAEVVYGTRFKGTHTSNMFFWHYLGNIFLNFVVNITFNSILSDMETGYKIIPLQLFKELKLRENDFRIEPEITCKLLIRKVKIIEVPISYVGRSYDEGKKITWHDGFKALNTILRIRLFGN